MKKTLKSLTNLSRFAPQSHWRSLGAYSAKNLLAWVDHVGAHIFGTRHAFMTCDSRYHIENQAKISLAGDWGTGTAEAERVALSIASGSPDYTIHLGDVYYTGTEAEIQENFLGMKASDFDAVAWPRGAKGTFALLGNHEMFSHGAAYFDILLPALSQPASYFTLENDFWRIVAVDTGYNSAGLEFGPFHPSCAIPPAAVSWLRTLDLMGDDRGIVLLSHHQPWSAFGETWYKQPAEQLAQFLQRPVLWFWGHEHRMAVYDKYALPGGMPAYGYCVGHGGMPVELKTPDDSKCKVLLTDPREYPNIEGLKVGYNGYATLQFDGPELRIEFLDLNGTRVHAESWMPQSL